MDYDKLRDEMNNILDKMGKVEPSSNEYENLVKRLAELQQMEIKWKQTELDEAKQNEDAALRRRELLAQEEDIRQRSKNSKRETFAEYGKTIIGGVFTLGAIGMTQIIEENDIIRTKGWNFITKLIPKL